MVLRHIILTVLVVLVLVSLYRYFDKYIKVGDAVEGYNLEKFGGTMKKILSNIEHFTTDSSDLIINGNFAGGKAPQNADKVYNSIQGTEIIQADNGGTGQYYLKIPVGANSYKLHVNLEASKSYKLSAMWYGQLEDTADNLYNICIPSTSRKGSQKNIALTCNGIMTQTRNKWTEMVQTFNTPDDLKSGGEVDIYLTYKPKVERFVTDISLTLDNGIDVPSSGNLKTYVTGDTFEGQGWPLSGGDSGMKWQNKPQVDQEWGAFITKGNTLMGGPSQDLLGSGGSNSFTILMIAVGLGGSGIGEALVIGGGQGSALRIGLPNSNGKVMYGIDNKKMTNLGDVGITNGSGVMHTYAIRYDADKKSGGLSVYIDNSPLVSDDNGITVPNLYYNKEPLRINADRQWNVGLHSVMIYNKALSLGEIKDANAYMLTNKGKHLGGDGGKSKVSGSLLMCTNGNTTGKLFLRDFEGNAAINFNNNNDPDNSWQYYESLGKDKLLELCIQEADMNPTGANLACQAYDSLYGNTYDCERNDFCPPAYFNNGKFWVYIPKKSYWAKKYGYWGARSYSNDIDNARAVYQVNFPECRVPDALRKEKYTGDMSKCPFVINKDNPCNDYACKDVDWTNPAHMKADLDNKCRISVSKYCSNNYDKDDSCVCWAPDNYEKDVCKQYRKQFSAIDWSLFNINDFAIEDHKDFNKTMRLARSTCWGCSGTDEQKSDRKYIVQVPVEKGQS